MIESVFHLTLIKNTGIAFGIFQSHSSLLFALISISIVVLALVAYRVCLKTAGHFNHILWGLSLILGGAIGNWIDRMRFQAVIDFLDFRIWPVFNIADASISTGVCLYLIVLFKKK